MSYYSKKLAGSRLVECYDIAPPRVRQYLAAEIRFVQEQIGADDVVLELGCGYGRVSFALAPFAREVVGIDSAGESVALARELAGHESNCEFLEMDALSLGFVNSGFDAVICVQNGICAFGVDQMALVREALRVTRSGGLVLFSSYCDRFWEHRLRWFELQAERGLVGKIDYTKSGNGIVTCEDGFSSGTMFPEDFEKLSGRLSLQPVITEVDNSSVFCALVAS